MTDADHMLLGAGESRDSLPVGAASYLDAHPGFQDPQPRIYVKFRPSGTDLPVLALLDTGGHYCILNRDVAELIGDQLSDALDSLTLRTAHGPVRGALYRHRIEFIAEEGPSLDIEATLFISPEWHAPCFLGYSGVLERIRFAIHPQTNRFLFAPLQCPA